MSESKKVYGSVQAGIIEHEELNINLETYGYTPEQIKQGLWTHQDRDINFTLVVDNFVIKYRDKNDADHLIAELQGKYEVTQ